VAFPARALPLACAGVLAAVLRLWAFDRVPANPFYDAAVRSMALSPRNFLYGAFEPAGSVSIDKPPIDLWLQVLSTKVLGFSSVGLRLPQAIAGIVAVVLLHGVVRRGFGRVAAAVAAFALAVFPLSVLTSRSDTMDTLMGTLLLLAAWAIVAAPPQRRRLAIVGAGAIAGLAFEVKLFEIVVALPGLAVLAWCVLEERDRVRVLLAAGAAFLATAAAWPVLAGFAPGPHPWPLGATDGTIRNVVLVYNGLNRLGYPGPESFSGMLPGPSPWRLATGRFPDYLAFIGVELVPALLLGGVVLVRHLRAGCDTIRTALAAGLGVWVLTGWVFFSVQGRPRLRYMESFTPAVAALLGIGVAAASAALARRRGSSANGVAIALTALVLAWPAATSLALVRGGAEDSQTLGAMPAGQLDALSGYLRAHGAGARYEVATSDPIIVGPLIAQDAQPVLMLTSWLGQPFTSPERLAALVRTGAVRHVLLAETGCRTTRAPSCAPAIRWALTHGTDVSAAAGLGPTLILLRMSAQAPPSAGPHR
jgi:4-amino-4-deoxy-L-arabinose transferase-like glycosyltransferase